MHNLTTDRYNGRYRGMGTVQGAATAESLAGAGVSATVSTLVAMGTIAGPVGLAISAIAGAGLAIASLFKGCGQTCVEATSIVNQWGTQIDAAFEAYMSAPIHYQSMQTAYLNLFDTTWQAVVAACSDPSLGAAGQACISDRAQGSCAYKTSPGGWTQGTDGKWTYVMPGANGSGTTCWNSFIGRRDPVAQDPTVVPDPAPSVATTVAGANDLASGLVSSVTSVSNAVGISPLLLLGAAAILGFMAMNEKGGR